MSVIALELQRIVVKAAAEAGIDGRDARLLRNGSNLMALLPAGIVVRVGRPGRLATAERELHVARWLAARGVRVVRPVPDVEQPIVVDGRPVTWWRALPPHRAGTPAELGSLLRDLHALSRPDLELPVHDPFAEVDEEIAATTVLDDHDRSWLIEHSARLRAEYVSQDPFLPTRLIHGDAWQSNVAVPADGHPVLLDFEKTCLGDPAWDLVPIAVDRVDFARLDSEEYQRFVTAYGGVDVLRWSGFRCCAAIQELRWVVFALRMADADERALPEVRHRIACLRGEQPTPWTWTAF